MAITTAHACRMMVAIALTLSFVMLIPSLPAQASEGTIGGTVTDMSTGQVIYGASVSISGKKSDGTDYMTGIFTTEYGYYELVVPVGDYIMTVEANGYYTKTLGVFVNSPNTFVNQSMQLQPAMPIDSRVTGFIANSETGEPVNNANIELSGTDAQFQSDFRSVRSDPTGYYEIPARPGEYRMRIFMQGYYTTEMGVYIEEPNSTLQINIGLDPPLPALVSIGGTVKSEGGTPVPDAHIVIAGTDEMGSDYSTSFISDSYGEYGGMIRPGSYSIQAIHPAYYPSNVTSFPAPSTNLSEIKWQNFTLAPSSPENCLICGIVKDATSTFPINRVQVQFTGTDVQGMYYSNYSFTDSYGYFEVNTRPGNYQVIAKKGDSYYDSQTTTLAVPQGETVWHNMSLTPIGARTSVIKGIVKIEGTNEAVVGAYVVAEGEDAAGKACSASAYSDSNGYFQLRVRGGSYALRIWENEQETEAIFCKYSFNLNVAAGESVSHEISLQVALPSESEVCGYITDSNTNKAIVNALVIGSGTDEQNRAYTVSCRSALDGFYRMNVRKGVAQLAITSRGYDAGTISSFPIGHKDVVWHNLSLTGGNTGNLPPTSDAGSDVISSVNQVITFDGSASYDPNSDPLSYYWDFGDGQFATTKVATHSYSIPGVYFVTLRVKDGRGGSDIDRIMVSINKPGNHNPVANAGSDFTAKLNEDVIFNASGTTDQDGDMLTYSWSFGDGTTGTGMCVNHTFRQARIYFVTLTVTDGNGGIATDTVKVTVTLEGNHAPTANAGDDIYSTVEKTIIFDGGRSSDPDGDKLTYIWDFGDGLTGEGVVTNHAFEEKGDYIVTLRVYDGRGGTDSHSIRVTVAPLESNETPPDITVPLVIIVVLSLIFLVLLIVLRRQPAKATAMRTSPVKEKRPRHVDYGKVIVDRPYGDGQSQEGYVAHHAYDQSYEPDVSREYGEQIAERPYADVPKKRR